MHWRHVAAVLLLACALSLLAASEATCSHKVNHGKYTGVDKKGKVAVLKDNYCRFAPPVGSLKRDSGGTWTTPMEPTKHTNPPDIYCKRLVKCQKQGAVGFGRFIEAVTGKCKSKSFDGYFGLDGVTFGILDFTVQEIIELVERYKVNIEKANQLVAEHAAREEGGKAAADGSGASSAQSPVVDQFDLLFKNQSVTHHMSGKCIDGSWLCDQNKDGLLNTGSFRSAFEKFIMIAWQEQLEMAVQRYSERIKKFKTMGLKTSYGVIGLAVVANNLKKVKECKPSYWMEKCKADTAGQDEAHLVKCLFDQYAIGNGSGCRHKLAGARRRRDMINSVFKGRESVEIDELDSKAVWDCANDKTLDVSSLSEDSTASQDGDDTEDGEAGEAEDEPTSNKINPKSATASSNELEPAPAPLSTP